MLAMSMKVDVKSYRRTPHQSVAVVNSLGVITPSVKISFRNFPELA